MGDIHRSATTKMRSTVLAALVSLTSGSPYYYLPATSYGLAYQTYPYYNYGQYSSPVAQYVAPAYATASYARSFNQVQPRLNVVGGQDIIAQTRSLSNSVQATLRQLASDPASVVIVNRIINDKDNICLSSLEEGIAGIETSTQLALSPAGRGQLKQSANTISAVVPFLTQLRANFARFSQICTADKQYNIESIQAVGDLMVNLADLFGSLGGVQTGENIRKGKTFVQ